MILLVGGTSESGPIALALANEGYSVLVSTATSVPLELPIHPRIHRRHGRLLELGLRDLALRERIGVLVDAAHPYAEEAHQTVRRVAEAMGLPLVSFARPSSLQQCDAVLRAPNHEAAARLAAVANGGPILLTIGSRHIEPYARATSLAGVPLFARVLDDADSVNTCVRAGISVDRIVVGRGPFSREENRQVLRRLGATTLVTKDSGEPGGFRAKLLAAHEEGCRVIVVERPKPAVSKAASTIAELVEAIRNEYPYPGSDG